MNTKSDCIICIIGKSGSGKSAIAEHYRLKGFNVIDSYTDRPKRYENETGHVFINTSEVEGYRKDMIAYTFFDNHHYFATRSQYREKGITFYVIDPAGVKELEDVIDDAKLLFIYINADEGKRRERMLKRLINGRGNVDNNSIKAFEEQVETRMHFDEKAFEVVKCSYVVDNNGKLQDTINKVDFILSQI